MKREKIKKILNIIEKILIGIAIGILTLCGILNIINNSECGRVTANAQEITKVPPVPNGEREQEYLITLSITLKDYEIDTTQEIITDYEGDIPLILENAIETFTIKMVIWSSGIITFETQDGVNKLKAETKEETIANKTAVWYTIKGINTKIQGVAQDQDINITSIGNTDLILYTYDKEITNPTINEEGNLQIKENNNMYGLTVIGNKFDFLFTMPNKEEKRQWSIDNDFGVSSTSYYQTTTDIYTKSEFNTWYSGYIEGQQNKEKEKQKAYNDGYAEGVNNANKYTFDSLIGAVIDVPIRTLYGIFNFEIFGMNMLGLIGAILGFAVVILILKVIL